MDMRKQLFGRTGLRQAVVAAMAGWALLGQAATVAPFTAWTVDSMRKVFKDDQPPAKVPAAAPIEAARQEVVSAQAVVWCAEPMEGLTCRAGPFVLGEGATLPAPRIRYEGYVGVSSKPVPNPLRPRPAEYPDPLYDRPPASVPAKTAQPVWLTIRVPSNAAPGVYRGSVDFEAKVGGVVQTASAPVAVQVYAALLPEKRTLKVSNWSWFDTPDVSAFCGVTALYQEPFWQLIENVARDMADHRSNVIFTPTTAWVWGQDDHAAAEDLILGTMNGAGGLAFDFSRFDRWVRTFRAAGPDVIIESGPLAKRTRKDGLYRSVVWSIENGKAVRREAESVSAEHERYLAVFLPALQAHLKEQGWSGSFLQHVLDEPNGIRKPVYVQVAAWVRKYGPGIRIVEAVQIPELDGAVDVWVPTLNKLAHSAEVYKAKQARGDELWFYTMDRPVEKSLTRQRLLPWANFASKTTGYLHWGYNWWVRSKDPRAGKWTLSPGSEWIVYPCDGGVVDSIRWEASLEGIQDYELLKALSVKKPAEAEAIAARLAPWQDGARELECSVEALRTARRELLSALGAPP